VVHEHSPQDSVFTLIPRRGLRFRIERQELLKRIQGEIGALSSLTAGEFDSRFFVAYADMKLKLDTTRTYIENNYALDVSTYSQLDSALPSEGDRSVRLFSLPLDSAKPNRTHWVPVWILTDLNSESRTTPSRCSMNPAPMATTAFCAFIWLATPAATSTP
jgi:hypothetical protein